MTRKLQALLDRRNTHLEKQANAIRLIIEKSVDPQLTGTLLSDLIMSVLSPTYQICA